MAGRKGLIFSCLSVAKAQSAWDYLPRSYALIMVSVLFSAFNLFRDACRRGPVDVNAIIIACI